MQMTDQWLSDIDRNGMVGALFDLIVHKMNTYGFNFSTFDWVRKLVEHRRFSLMVVFSE